MSQRNRNARLLTGGLVGVPPGAVGRRGVGTYDTGDEHWNDVSLLIRGDTLTDLSGNHTITNNGVTAGDTTYTKHSASGSMSFDGVGDILSIPDDTSLEFGSDDFTVECWAYYDGNMPNNSYVFFAGKTDIDANKSPFIFGTTPTSGGSAPMRFLVGTSSTYYTAQDPDNFPISQWVHVAGTRSGNTITLWINGVAKASTTMSGAAVDNSQPLYIGKYATSMPTGAVHWKGNIEDFRITKGVARYTAGFSSDLPTESFPTVLAGTPEATATLRTRGYIGAAPAGSGGMLTLYHRYIDAFVKKDGLTAATAGDSAAQILADYPSSPDGIYYIKDGTGTKQVYCDMTNGGWMLYSSFASTNSLDATNYPAWNGNRILHSQLGTYGYAAIGAGILNYNDGTNSVFPGTPYAHATGFYGCYWYSTSGPQSGGVGATTWNGPSDVSELRIRWGQGSPSLTGTCYLDINGSQVTSMSSAGYLDSTYSFNPSGTSHYFGVRDDGIVGISFVYMR